MRRLLSGMIACLGLVWAGMANAQTLETEASHALIMDYESGEVLWHHNGYEPMVPASMTKMMTAYLVFDRLATGELESTDQFSVSERAWREGGWASGGSTMGLAIDDRPTVEELLRGVIILSGNDACIVLAEGIAGSEEAFAREMTNTAHAMGLDSATFENSTGLYTDDQRIAPRDLAELARQLIRNFPQYYPIYSETAYEWRGIRQPNRNPLLGRMEGADGLKTGHLEISGYGLTASAERDGVRRIVVLNGMESEAARAREAERLMQMAFRAFDTRTLTPGGIDLPALPVWMGERDTVSVSLAEPLRVTAYRRAFEEASVEIVYESPLEAPVQQGTEIARLVLTMPDREPISAPLVATETVGRTGFVGRVLDGLNAVITGGA